MLKSAGKHGEKIFPPLLLLSSPLPSSPPPQDPIPLTSFSLASSLEKGEEADLLCREGEEVGVEDEVEDEEVGGGVAVGVVEEEMLLLRQQERLDFTSYLAR